MGFGDDVITTALARRAFQQIGKKVRPGNGAEVEWSAVFDHSPYLDKSSGPWLKCSTGHRPYIDYAKCEQGRFAWNYGFKVEPGHIELTADERKAYPQRDFVMIEPNTKRALGNNNKDWGFEKWQEVVRVMPHVCFLQAVGNGKQFVALQGVEAVDTKSFRDACALLSHASLFVGTDGGLHHAAAALGVRAVVVWGGFAPPSILGYDMHTNLCKARDWCGMLTNCMHCRQAMDSISIDEVVSAIDHALDSVKRAAA